MSIKELSGVINVSRKPLKNLKQALHEVEVQLDKTSSALLEPYFILVTHDYPMNMTDDAIAEWRSDVLRRSKGVLKDEIDDVIHSDGHNVDFTNMSYSLFTQANNQLINAMGKLQVQVKLSALK